VAQVETLLRACIDDYNKSQVAELQKLRKAQPEKAFEADNFIINLLRYKRQLVAIMNTKGEKEVWVNCFSDEKGADWRHEISTSTDRGNYHFKVYLNLTKHEWNGPDISGDPV
jgi:hypothetical protein